MPCTRTSFCEEGKHKGIQEVHRRPILYVQILPVCCSDDEAISFPSKNRALHQIFVLKRSLSQTEFPLTTSTDSTAIPKKGFMSFNHREDNPTLAIYVL